MVVISLIGEQPIPNLLPMLHLKPNIAVLVHTNLTKNVALRLKELLIQQDFTVELLHTEPYDIGQIQTSLEKLVKQKGWAGDNLVFNLTGGTKTMVLAAYQVAQNLQAPFVYFQSEGKCSILYRYGFEEGKPRFMEREVLPGLLNIDLYLKAHVGDYKITGPKHQFEKAICEALRDEVDEVMVGVSLAGALEVDLIVRKGNQFGVIQAKTGSKARTKEGLDQLNAACTRERLGIYTSKILIINQQWDHTLSNLKELADAWGIKVIELPSFTDASPNLSPEDQERLRDQVIKVLT